MKICNYKKVIYIIILFIAVIFIGIFLSLFIIGEPIESDKVLCTASLNEQNLELCIETPESAVAFRGWKHKQKGKALYISGNKVLVSSLFDNGSYKTSVDVSLIENIYLGGKLIWPKNEKA